MATARLFKEKKARLELMERLFEVLDNEEKWTTEKTIWYDTDKPRLDDDGNPKTRKDGSIIYEQSYRYETIPEDELDDDAKFKLTAIQTLKNQLEKML